MSSTDFKFQLPGSADLIEPKACGQFDFSITFSAWLPQQPVLLKTHAIEAAIPVGIVVAWRTHTDQLETCREIAGPGVLGRVTVTNDRPICLITLDSPPTMTVPKRTVQRASSTP